MSSLLLQGWRIYYADEPDVVKTLLFPEKKGFLLPNDKYEVNELFSLGSSLYRRQFVRMKGVGSTTAIKESHYNPLVRVDQRRHSEEEQRRC